MQAFENEQPPAAVMTARYVEITLGLSRIQPSPDIAGISSGRRARLNQRARGSETRAIPTETRRQPRGQGAWPVEQRSVLPISDSPPDRPVDARRCGEINRWAIQATRLACVWSWTGTVDVPTEPPSPSRWTPTVADVARSAVRSKPPVRQWVCERLRGRRRQTRKG
jgi:hypothetical protein